MHERDVLDPAAVMAADQPPRAGETVSWSIGSGGGMDRRVTGHVVQGSVVLVDGTPKVWCRSSGVTGDQLVPLTELTRESS